MNYKTIPFISGVAKNPHPRLIPEDKCSDCKNVIFQDGRIKRRPGYVKLGSNLPLNGAVTAISWFELIGTSTTHAIVFTESDAYRYDAANATWLFITHVCNTNGANTSGSGNRTVTANVANTFSTTWSLTNTYEIGFGNANVNAINTWYSVASVDSGTVLTLAEDGPTYSTGPYCMRLCFGGDIDDRHSVALPLDNAADRILVATTGYEPIKKWDGTNTMTDLGGSPNKAKYVKFFGPAGGERLYTMWTIDTGENQPQTIEFSQVGDPEDWTAGHFQDFVMTNDEIRGCERLQSRLMLYKAQSISMMAPEGPSADDPLIIQQNVVNEVGTRSGYTIVGFDKFHIFLGSDDKVYFYDGINIEKVSTDIETDLIGAINTGKVGRSFAFHLPDDNLYVLMIPTVNDYPDRAYVFNYQTRAWSIWEFAHQMTAVGIWKDQSLMTIQDLYDSGDTYEDLYSSGIRLIDWLQVGDVPTVLFGDKDGYVYEWDKSGDDDGTEIDAYVVSRDLPLVITENGEMRNSKLLKLEVGLVAGTGELQICSSPNYGETWSPWATISLSGATSYVERVAQIIQRGRQHRFWIQNVDGANFEIESMTAGFIEAGGNIDK